MSKDVQVSQIATPSFRAKAHYGVKELYFVSHAMLVELRKLNDRIGSAPHIVQSGSKFEAPTLRVLEIMKMATASEVAEHTGRARATESRILNGLERRGMCQRVRRGIHVAFELKKGNVS